MPIKIIMTSIYDKKDLILKHEETFADAVALAVIDRPQLNIWMILIPVIFVYHFYRLKKFADGRKDFAKNFIITRKRALEEALSSVTSGGKPDMDGLARMSSVPEKIYGAYKKWLRVLWDHYQDLLRAKGDTFEALVRSSYKNRTNYLLFFNHLNRVERRFNTALKPHLYESTEGVDGIVTAIESISEQLRRKEAERIFP